MDYSRRTRRTMGDALMTEGFSREALAFVGGEASTTTASPAVPARAEPAGRLRRESERPPRRIAPPVTGHIWTPPQTRRCR